jgi:ParB/RepB/Spo0J family partition protein
MTSGVFHLVPMTDIVVNRDERQRRELTDIDVLADSIRRLGLIHPIVVTRELELIAGERRYAATTMLGWPAIPVQFVDEMDPKTLKAIELEENIKRQDITWQDHARAVREYHLLMKSTEPDWTMEKTSAAIGLASKAHVSMFVSVADELVAGNKSVTDAPRFSTARGLVVRAQERARQAVLEGVHDSIGGIRIAAQQQESILLGDFCDWVHTDIGLRFNFIHCDFPYGIWSDEFNQGGAASHGGYTDTPETWERLMIALDAGMKRGVIAESAHLMFWFAMRRGNDRMYEYTARYLERMGWYINPIPLIWMKSDGAGIIPDPERGPRQIYETCFLGARGDRKIVRAVNNAYAAPTVRERHMSEKPEPMLRHFFGMLVDENTVMLDPTCGSGSALRAAESVGAKYVLGIEANSEFAALARTALKQARALRAASAIVNDMAV